MKVSAYKLLLLLVILFANPFNGGEVVAASTSGSATDLSPGSGLERGIAWGENK